MIGRVVRDFRIEEKIGGGSMGVVYRGLDLMLGRPVALKVIRPELASEAQFVDRFRTEAMAMGNLNHPNVTTVHGLFREGDDLFLVMEFVRGESLDHVIKREGSIPWRRARALFCGALDGIEQAHARGIIHRDIKPANLLLTHEGALKVMDFGIARMAGSGLRTRTGYLVGTLLYMPPEQVRGRDVDARSDIYSLGIVLFQMLTGEVPFKADSDFELMRKQIEETPPPPLSLAPHLPTALDAAILRALEKDPAKRFQTVREFKEALLETDGQATTRDPSEPLDETVTMRLPAAPVLETLRSSGVSEANKPTRVSPQAKTTVPPVADLVATRAGADPTRVSLEPAREGSLRKAVVAAVAIIAAAVLALVLFARRPGGTPPLPEGAPPPESAPAGGPPSEAKPKGALERTAPPGPEATRRLPGPPAEPPPQPVMDRPSAALARAPSPPVEVVRPSPPAYSDTFECRLGAEFNVDPEEAEVAIWNLESQAEPIVIGIADDWDGSGGGKVYSFDKEGTYYARFSRPGYQTTWVKIVVTPAAKDRIADVDTELEKSRR